MCSLTYKRAVGHPTPSPSQGRAVFSELVLLPLLNWVPAWTPIPAPTIFGFGLGGVLLLLLLLCLLFWGRWVVFDATRCLHRLGTSRYVNFGIIFGRFSRSSHRHAHPVHAVCRAHAHACRIGC